MCLKCFFGDVFLCAAGGCYARIVFVKALARSPNHPNLLTNPNNETSWWSVGSSRLGTIPFARVRKVAQDLWKTGQTTSKKIRRSLSEKKKKCNCLYD